MNASEARTQLLGQHEELRAILAVCTRYAQLYRSCDVFGGELDEALASLRELFEFHNRTETALVQKFLRGPSAWSSLLVDRMIEEHVAEHAAFGELLSGTRLEVSKRIEELAEELDGHMAAEERTFLSPVTLSEDVIRVRVREGYPE